MSERDDDLIDRFTRFLSQGVQTLREWIEEVSQEIESRRKPRCELISRPPDGVEKVQYLINEILHWEPAINLQLTLEKQVWRRDTCR